MLREEGAMFMGGLTLLTAGVAMVLTHNIWSSSWVVIVTIIGWATAIKGFALLAMPRLSAAMYDRFMKGKSLIAVGAVVWAILGLVLAYFGFYS